MSAETLRAKIREIPDFPKPGILFYDITTLLKDPAAYKEAIDLMLEPYRGEQIDLVVGMESRGFIFSAPMAYQLDTGLVPGPQAGQAAGRDADRRVRAGVRVQHARDPSRRDRRRPAGADRGRPARDRRDGARHDRAGRAAQGRGRGSRVPRRARLPQGPGAARGTQGHQRHPVLSRWRGDTRPVADEPARPSEPVNPPDPNRRRVLPPVRGRRRCRRGLRHRGRPAPPAGVGRRPPASCWAQAPPAGEDAAGAGRLRPRTSRAEPREDAPPARAGGRRSAGTATSAGSSTSAGSRTCSSTSRSAAPPRAWRAIRDGALVGAPAQAQLAAVTLALVAGQTRTHRGRSPGGRRSAARRTRSGSTRPGSAPLAADREPDGRAGRGPARHRDAPGDEIAAAIHAEAAAIIAEAVRRPRRARRPRAGGAGRLPGGGDDERAARARVRQHRGDGRRPVRDGAVGRLSRAPRRPPVRALVAETRPGLEGSRVAAWELREAGVPHAVITDAAAPGRIAAGEVDVVLVARRPDRRQRRRDRAARAPTRWRSPRRPPACRCRLRDDHRASTRRLADGAAAQLEEGLPDAGPARRRAPGSRPMGTEVRNPLQDRDARDARQPRSSPRGRSGHRSRRCGGVRDRDRAAQRSGTRRSASGRARSRRDRRPRARTSAPVAATRAEAVA